VDIPEIYARQTVVMFAQQTFKSQPEGGNEIKIFHILLPLKLHQASLDMKIAIFSYLTEESSKKPA
jgi:hypothetical protein